MVLAWVSTSSVLFEPTRVSVWNMNIPDCNTRVVLVFFRDELLTLTSSEVVLLNAPKDDVFKLASGKG